MNVREGMRRLGILLEAGGALLGAWLSYGDAKSVWERHTAHRQFESLIASSTMRRVAKALREYQNAPLVKNPWVEFRFNERSGQIDLPPDYKGDIVDLLADANFQKLDLASQKAVLGRIDSRFNGLSDFDLKSFKERMEAKRGPERAKDWFALNTPDKGGGMAVLVNLDGVKDVLAGKDGIFQIDLLTGQALQRTEAPHFSAYVRLLLNPFLGFLLPWGAARVLTWVGSGFFAPHQ